jgi:histone-arginine methyltransferase CARM1
MAALIHGIAGWFDLEFIGSQESVTLSTAPESAGTHWYQCRLLLREPLAANKGQSVSGVIKFTANQFFSYDVDLTLQLVGTDIASHSRINLKDQVMSYIMII